MLARSTGAACARLTNAITSANANGRAGDTTATGLATALARVSDMRGQGDRAAPALRLGRLEPQPVLPGVFERQVDREAGRVQVDILPVQRQQFVAAHPGLRARRCNAPARAAARRRVVRQ